VKFSALIISLFFIAVSNAVAQNAPISEVLGSANCASGEFRGMGIGRSESEALNLARSDLASQIYSSLKVSTKYSQNQQVHNGKENISSAYKSEFVVEANLLNAHDARVLRVERRAGEAGVVVCMSRANAAKGFVERQRLVADSLELASSTVLNAGQHKRKNEAWKRTQTLWNEFVKIQTLLEGWGVATSDFFGSSIETYANAKADYKYYCQNLKIHWEDTGGECPDVAFSVLSKTVKMEKKTCSSGLKLRFSCSEKCASSSFGAECYFEPSLSIESCGGEPYSLLKPKDPIKGYDMYNKAKARDKLLENFPKAAFFNEWEKEIKEWEGQCAE